MMRSAFTSPLRNFSFSKVGSNDEGLVRHKDLTPNTI